MSTDLQQRFQLLHGESEGARGELARIKATGRPTVVVSACLVGVRCRPDGRDRALPDVVTQFAEGAEIVPLCPEVLARLGVPRPTIHFSADGKQLVTERGKEVTSEVEAGARLADMLAQQVGATRALLKERSPSCGVHKVHGPDGIVDGQGRFAARLAKRGLPIVGEDDPVR